MRMDAVIRVPDHNGESGESGCESPKVSPAEIRKRYLEAVVTSPSSSLATQLGPPPITLSIEPPFQKLPVAVPTPPEIAATPFHADSLMDYLVRRREAQKKCYKLSEGDLKLISMNSKDITFTSGTIMFGDSQSLSGLFRIKSGKVLLMKQSQKLFEMDRGFIGEVLLVNGGETCCQGYTLVASGPVVISEISLPFLLQLMEADNLLAFKIYRQIAAKLAAVLYSVITLALDSSHREPSLPLLPTSPVRAGRSESFSSTDSGSSNGDSGSGGSGVETGSGRHQPSRESSQDLSSSSLSVVSGSGGSNGLSGSNGASGGRFRKKFTCNKKKESPYKVYSLESGALGAVTVQLTESMIIVVSPAVGFKLKRKIKYDKILDVAKTGKTSVTIIYDMQAKTLFFKQEADRDEFFTIVQSLLGIASPSPQLPEPDPSSCPAISKNPDGTLIVPKTRIHPACDKYILRGIATKQVLNKGDVIVAEGDLYQRIYTIVEGRIDMKHEGKPTMHLIEGEVFGILTLFHLRPSKFTFEVVSDTVTLLIIPAHKFVDLAYSNLPLSVRMHKRACQVMVDQIGNTLKSQKEVVTGFSEPHIFM